MIAVKCNDCKGKADRVVKIMLNSKVACDACSKRFPCQSAYGNQHLDYFLLEVALKWLLYLLENFFTVICFSTLFLISPYPLIPGINTSAEYKVGLSPMGWEGAKLCLAVGARVHQEVYLQPGLDYVFGNTCWHCVLPVWWCSAFLIWGWLSRNRALCPI